MKILVVSTWFPFPPDNGSKTRAYNLLSRVGARHTLDLLALTQSPSDMGYLDDVRAFCRRVEVFPKPRFHPERARSWMGFLSPTPRYFLEHHCPAMNALASRWASEESYDAVIAVTLGAAPYVAALNIPVKILDQHNVESQVIKRRWRHERSLLRRLRYAPTWIKADRFERMLAVSFDAIAVVSEPERDLMRKVLGNGHAGKVHVIPNGVAPGLLEYDPPARDPGVLAFTGGIAYQPNYDAAVRLCRRVLPMVRASFPEARVLITGRTDGIDTHDLAAIPGVELTGYVEDIRPVVASASALVVPLRYGGGTRLKVLEAMALGAPVISTSVGAEGLDARGETHILLGDTDEELAKQTVRLLTDPDLAARIARNARELVQVRYCWPAIASEFERVLDAASALPKTGD